MPEPKKKKIENEEERTSTARTGVENAGVVRVEANVEELPIFSATKRSRKEEIVTWKRTGRDPRTGNPVEQQMIIRPARGLGLPGKVERDLYYLVICPWIEENGFGPGGTIGPITYREAVSRLEWTKTGPNYGKVREALKTLVSINFEFTNCIIDGESREFEQYVYGHMFERVDGLEQRQGRGDIKRGEFVIMAGDWYVRNHELGYTKPIDLGVYRALASPVAQSLYQYLDKRAYSARQKRYYPEVEEDVLELKERFRLGMSRNADVLRLFRRAHSELMSRWPVLQDAQIKKIRPGYYKCIYTFDIQQKIPFGATPQQKAKPKDKSQAVSSLAQELVARGMTLDVAKKLVADYPDEQIRRQIDIHDFEARSGQKMTNPAGRLRKRLVEDWAAPEGYQTPEKRQESAERRSRAAREAAEEEDQRVNWWKYEKPEVKARLDVAGPWTARWKSVHGWNQDPPAEEEEAAYQEALKLRQQQAEEGKKALDSQ